MFKLFKNDQDKIHEDNEILAAEILYRHRLAESGKGGRKSLQ